MYGLLALSTALALFYNGVVRAASVRDSGQKTMRFNVAVAAVSALMALLFGGGLEAPHGDTSAFGLLYGGTISLNLFFRARALETGPLSATLLLGCSSMLITTALGALLWHETVAPVQAAGVAAMLLAMFMSIAPGRGGVVSRKWVLYSAGLFVTNGVSGLILKGHQSSAGADRVWPLAVYWIWHQRGGNGRSCAGTAQRQWTGSAAGSAAMDAGMRLWRRWLRIQSAQHAA